ARVMDTLCVDLAAGALANPVCTSIGNPHATFFVGDAEAVDLAALGPLLEHDALFPERANIGVATVRGPERIRLRVWERGAGITHTVIVNTCAVTAEAERQARQAIRRARREHPSARIIVTGCAATLAPERYAALGEVDLVLDNEAKLKVESYDPHPPAAGAA